MAELNIRFKDKTGNYLYPRTKVGNIVLEDGTALDLSKYATTVQLTEALADLPHIKKEVVDELPLISEASENTLYLVPSDATEDRNILLEYLLIEGAWELVGSTKTDLSGLVTDDELTNALTAKADTSTTYTKTEVDTALTAKADTSTTYTKTEVDKLISDLSGEMGDIQYEVLD